MSVIRLKKIVACVLFSFLLATQYSYAKETKEVRIGVLAIWGKEVAYKIWQPTINYLNKTILGHHFVLKPLKLEQTIEFVKKDNIDFILTNPGNYIVLEAQFGISRLATLKTKKQNKTSSQFSAVIFTHNNRKDIQTLDDLRNKSFMGVKKNAFGGFQMAWLEFKNHDINPFKDFSSLQFSGFPHDNVVYAVLDGKIDAGTVRTTTLERMDAEGLINLSEIKVLNHKVNSNFPFLHSTQLYPEWPIAKLKNTSAKLSKSLSIALLKLSENSLAAKKSGSSGWSVPLDYFPVRNLFKELNLAPYNVVLPGFFERYGMHSLLFLILFLQPLLFYIYKLKVNLRIDEEKLSQSETQWTNALNFLDEPMYMVDLDDRVIRANKAFYKKIEAKPKEVIGNLVTDFTHPEGEETPCKVCQARKDQIDTTIVLEADDPVNKTSAPLEISVKVVRNNENQAICIIQKMRDLSKSRESEKALRRSESLFKELLDSTPEPLVVSKSNGHITLVNSQFEKEFGYSREEIIGQKIEKLMPQKYREQHVNIRAEYSRAPYTRQVGEGLKLKAQHKDGRIFPVDLSLSPFTIDNELLVITIINDISDRLEKETELKRLASFPEFNPNPIIEFKKNGTVTYANPSALKWFPSVINEGSKHDILAGLETEYSSLEKNHQLTRNIRVADSTFEQKITYNSDTQLFRTYIWDITKLRNLTQKMTYQATHDVLTNLINRREFERRLKQKIDETKYNNKTHSLCYMDLDQFKAVNDSCGHAAGDELLKQVSAEINLVIRDSDTFARLGGDEFGILLSGCPIDKAIALAEDARIAVEKFRFHWDNKTFKVGISIGLVTINNSSGSSKDVLSAADTACYIAKEQGRNRVHVYEPGSTEIEKYAEETNWLNRINTALDHNEFVLYFQKIASLHNSSEEHYEVLIRMLIEGKTILPNSFIPAAERFNIMSSVDSWVIKNTLSIMEKEKYLSIDFSVNLSGQSLSNLQFMQNCIDQIAHSDINPGRLCFEITETAMIQNLSNAIRSITILRDLGCKIALDDFGSGLSSFAYLKNLPVDYLKIDGSLVKEMDKDNVNVTMVKSIIHIGHSMGLKTIAEYVENDKVLNILQDLKIDFVQGYGVAKPILLEDIELQTT